MEPVPMTPRQVAERLRCDEKTVRRMVNRGELPGYKVGNRLRILSTVVDAHMNGAR